MNVQTELFPGLAVKSDRKTLTIADVPNALFPTDNQYDIPLLDINMQANYIDAPVVVWGSHKRRNRTYNGTFCFYTSDRHFEGLWKNPQQLINSGAPTAVEANFTITDQTPYALSLWKIYRKRWLARWWQSRGVRILVDLNVDESIRNENLLGVPSGWNAYATRGYSEQIDCLEKEYNLALSHAQSASILFLVYGGGLAVKEWCMHSPVVWVPERSDIVKGKENGK